MENMTKYRIVLTCWDKEKREPYADFIDKLFDSREEADAAMRASVKDELETLNEREFDDVQVEYPMDCDQFRADFDGDEFDAVIRFWDGDDYWPVTGYSIHALEKDSHGMYCYRRTSDKNHGFYITINKRNQFAVHCGDEVFWIVKTLDEALGLIDDDILKHENAHLRPTSEKEKEWTLPVTWEVCGFVKVKARTLEEAIENFDCDSDLIPLPAESSYVDGSFQLTCRDDDFIRIYNK